MLPSARRTLHVVTVCTGPGGWFAALRASAERLGYRLTVLGWGVPWGGFMSKVHVTRRHLQTLPADDLVLFVDAFDVVLLEGPDTLLARYHAALAAASAGGDAIVVAVENPLREPVARLYKQAIFGTCAPHNGPVNSGAWMGRVAQCSRLLRRWCAAAARIGTADDQKALNHACLAAGADRLVIDLDGDLFFHATCVPALPGILTTRCGHLGLDPHLRNPLTGRRPVVLHAPGVLDLDPVCRRLGLPRGVGRPRWRWIVRNFWLEMAAAALLCALLCLLLRRLLAGSCTR